MTVVRRVWAGPLLVSTVALAAAPPACGEAARIRVAILGFQDYAGKPEAKGLGASFGRLLGVAMGSDNAVRRRIQIVERSELRQVMDEKKLDAAGLLDPATAHASGRLLGVSYFITGGIEAFSTKRDRKGIPPFRADVVEATATVSVRFIDTRTGVQALAFHAEARSSDKIVTMDTKDPKNKAEWTRTTEAGLLDELLKRAAREAVQELKKQDRLQELKPIEILGRIVRVERKQAWLNLGSEAGVAKEDRFEVLRLGKPLIDKLKGSVLGSEEKRVDTGEVEAVSPGFSVLRVRLGLARVNDVVRPLNTQPPVSDQTVRRP